MRALLLSGYLLLVVLLLWCEWCALTPRQLPPANGYLRWAFSFIINEVPAVAVYALLGATAGLLAAGALDTPAGWIGLALTTFALGGAGAIAWRQLPARRSVVAAMAAGMGRDRSVAPAAGALRTLRRPRWAWLVWLTPLRVRRRDVERVADVAYGAAGAANTLDVYRHRSRPVGAPVLIHLHGGALRRGRKDRQGLPLIYGLATSGWLCISANYRLQPDVTFPEHLIDVKRVIAWVRAEGQKYGADPAAVFIAGGSSGAQLAALAALTADDAAYQPGFEAADTSVTAAVALYGYYGPVSTTGGRRAGYLPVSHLRADAPPFFVAHGDADTLTSVAEARHFAESLRRVSVNPVVYAELPGAQHGFDTFRSVRADAVVDAVKVFAAHVLTPVRRI